MVSDSLAVSHELGLQDGRMVRYCLYGPIDGRPVIFHGGSPGTRWKRPDIVEATEQSGIRLLVHDRPGYGGSTRQSGRTVADVTADVLALADAQRWGRFAVAGGSGGGPHALACAALLPDRVTRCAVVSSISPPDTSGPAPADDEQDPRRNLTSWLAAHDQGRLRANVEDAARAIMATIEAGGPELLPDPNAPTLQPAAGPALKNPAAMARLRATFVDSHDGWLDDNVAFARPWGFELASITVPVSLWYGSRDQRSRTYADWLSASIQTAARHEYPGGHVQDAPAYRRMLAWLLPDLDGATTVRS